MSQQIDASLTVGVNMEYQNAVSQFEVFKRKVEGEEFSISAGVPKDILNTEATKKALQGIKNELVDIDKVRAKVSFFEVDGKKFPGYGMMVQDYAHGYGSFYKLEI